MIADMSTAPSVSAPVDGPRAVPRSVIVATAVAVTAVFAVAIWAWMRWGEGVFFDVGTNGLSGCL